MPTGGEFPPINSAKHSFSYVYTDIQWAGLILSHILTLSVVNMDLILVHVV
jgi:hypothetical protein